MRSTQSLRRSFVPGLARAAIACSVLSVLTTAQSLHTTRVAFGLTRPTGAYAAPGDAHRLFVTEQWTGKVRIITNGTLLATPFLSVGALSTDTEQGLLGLTFHPNYATNGKLYVDLTDASGATIVREYTVSATNPNLANAASARPILPVAQPYSNHNGGCLQFGPDGYLYVSLGDGGSSNDADGNGQNLNVLLGKLLRIDVDGDDFPTDPNKNYAIPPTNPFAGAAPGADEIWHYGLRNPWRFSFDRLTGDLFIGDVGEGEREEIDFAPAASGGLDFGWRCMEGNSCTGLAGCTCNSSTLKLPIQTYPHSQGCSITGGCIYRGNAIPALRGTYFYADYCSDRIWSLRFTPGGGVSSPTDRTAELVPTNGATINGVVAFGEDARGELLIVEQNGEIWRIDGPPPGTAVCSGDGSLSTACPCGNSGGPGRGCANSLAASGAEFSADGVTSPDTIRFTAAGLPATTSCLFLKSDAFNASGFVFGDGILCLSGSLLRFGTGAAIGGTAFYPGPTDVPVSTRSQVSVGSGTTSWYQVYYRNAGAYCTPQSFNVTNGYRLIW